jgi:hypothetical protein
MARCKLCHREIVEGEYCGYHREAYTHLVDTYDAWKASTGASWTEFLSEASTTKEIGAWARDVAQDLLSKGSARE